jgi:hypothetical protein
MTQGVTQTRDNPEAIVCALIAYHEAGQIVVRHRLGATTAARRIAVLLAGAIAEALACACRGWPLDERELFAADGAEWMRIQRLLARRRGVARGELLSQATRQAAAIVTSEWATVEEIASALHRRRPLCYLEVALILA